MSNYRITNAKITKDLYMTHGPMSIEQKYQIIFTLRKKSDDPPNGQRKSLRRYVMLNIPALNYLLWNKADKYKTPQDVIRDFTVEGVCVTEEGKEQPYLHPDEFGKERILNNVIVGNCQAYNIWGINISPGTSLYLLVMKKKRSYDTTFVLNPSSGRQTVKKTKSEASENPIQVIPWAHEDYSYPPDQVLKYDDGDGTIRRAFVIYIGKVESNVEKSNDRTYRNVTTDIESIVSQPTMTINFDAII